MSDITQPDLSRDEWRAVSIALNDAAERGCAAPETPGLLRRLYVAFSGNEPRPPLADARLEAIRRFVCATRRARKPAERLVPALRAQGFTPAQVDALALLAA